MTRPIHRSDVEFLDYMEKTDNYTAKDMQRLCALSGFKYAKYLHQNHYFKRHKNGIVAIARKRFVDHALYKLKGED